MKSGDKIRVISTGETGEVKATSYHYLDAKHRINKVLIKLDKNSEMITLNATEVTSELE